MRGGEALGLRFGVRVCVHACMRALGGGLSETPPWLPRLGTPPGFRAAGALTVGWSPKRCKAPEGRVHREAQRQHWGQNQGPGREWRWKLLAPPAAANTDPPDSWQDELGIAHRREACVPGPSRPAFPHGTARRPKGPEQTVRRDRAGLTPDPAVTWVLEPPDRSFNVINV